MKALRVAGLLAAALVTIAAAAADPAEKLSDPALEARARAIFREVRCLVCQNESIDDSEADLAADLRRIVREQISAGKSDREVLTYLTDRYGEFVLFKPSFSIGNAVLWTAPFLLVALGGAAFVLSRRRAGDAAQLSAEEEARLSVLTQTSGPSATVPPQAGSTDAADG